MKLEYWSANNLYVEYNVISVAGTNNSVMIFTTDYGDHHKFMIEGNILKRYEMSIEFYRIFPIKYWRLVP